MIPFSLHLDAPRRMLLPNPEISTKVKGTVFYTDTNGTLVDITVKSSAYLSVSEVITYKIKHVEEAGIDITLKAVTCQDGMTTNWYNFDLSSLMTWQEEVLPLPKRHGKIRCKIYDVDLSDLKWTEVVDKVHKREEIAWLQEPKPDQNNAN